MSSKKKQLYYVRGLFNEEDFLRILADRVLDLRGYSDKGINRISLMTIIKNVKNKNPKRQFRVEIIFNKKPQKLKES